MRTFVSILCVALLFSMSALSIEAKSKKKANKANTTQVIFTGDIAKKVYGYNGKTPVNIHVKDGKITQIEVLPNEETPQYLKRAVAKVCTQYEGKTISEALKIKADVATGATYTSEALIKNIQMGLEQASQSSDKGKSGSKRR